MGGVVVTPPGKKGGRWFALSTWHLTVTDPALAGSRVLLSVKHRQVVPGGLSLLTVNEAGVMDLWGTAPGKVTSAV